MDVTLQLGRRGKILRGGLTRFQDRMNKATLRLGQLVETKDPLPAPAPAGASTPCLSEPWVRLRIK